MVNLTCPLGLAMGCPVIRLHIILGIPVKVFLDEMNI